jgi:hypothetical protein
MLQVTQIMVPLLKFYFHEDVRIAAVQCMPELLRSATLAVEKGTSPDASMPAQMLDFFWQPLLDAMHKVLKRLSHSLPWVSWAAVPETIGGPCCVHLEASLLAVLWWSEARM